MGRRIVPADTIIDAALMQFDMFGKRGPRRRAAMVFELAGNRRATVEACVCQRHPDYDVEQPHRLRRKAAFLLVFGHSR